MSISLLVLPSPLPYLEHLRSNQSHLTTTTTWTIPRGFRVHSTLWSCTSTDRKGHEIADLLLATNMCLLNNEEPTYIHPVTGTHSSIDLALCHPSLFLDLSWKLHEDLCGSDHFPIILTQLNASHTQETQRWKLEKADGDSYAEICSTELVCDDVLLQSNPIESFTEILVSNGLSRKDQKSLGSSENSGSMMAARQP